MSDLSYNHPIVSAVANAAVEVDVGDDLLAAQELLTAALDNGDEDNPLNRIELLLASIAAATIAFARAVTGAMEDDDE